MASSFPCLSPVSIRFNSLPILHHPLSSTAGFSHGCRHSRKSRQISSIVVTAQFNGNKGIYRVLRTAWQIGKDGIDAGTNLVPESVPRPVARIGITVFVGIVSLFLLKSVLSTVFFVAAMMGFIYFVFIALNKDEGPRGGNGSGGGSSSTTEESLEEARRIMEKYK